jgi:four helix bundle protein
LKELNETSVWLKLILRSGLIRIELMADIIDENQQLSKIISASLKTAKAATAR